MAPRGRRKAGLMRADGARDAMRAYGFPERLINLCIKELLQVYGDEGWFLIEDCSYTVLLNKCLEMSDEQDQTLSQDTIQESAEEQNNEMVEAEQEQTPKQEEEKEQEHEHQVEDGRDHVGSNSTSLMGCVAETGTKICQTEALPITSKTDILDSSPAGEASAMDYASPVAFPSADASGGFAQHSVEGAKSSGCGWLSEDSDEDEDPDADSVGDDDEMIQLTPEPLCEELEKLISEIRGEKKRKRPTRWEDLRSQS